MSADGKHQGEVDDLRKQDRDERQQDLRLLGFLRFGAAGFEGDLNDPDERLILQGPRGSFSADGQQVQRLNADGLLHIEVQTLKLTEQGRTHWASLRERQDLLLARPITVDRKESLRTGGEEIQINLAESPLAQIARRRDRNGMPFLDEREIRAGERLRADFTLAQMSPRLGIAWEPRISSGNKGSGRGGGNVEMLDHVLAARQCVEQAIAATGPELSGVLLDICCFLKGMEQVEMERSWPSRSAKLMLKAGLSALSRHYEPDAARRTRQAPVLHWGTEDYRPQI